MKAIDTANPLVRGAWLTPARMQMFAILSLCATVAMVVYLFATAHGTVDSFGRPLGTDFSNVWTAGRMALDGRAPLAWNWPAHFAMQQLVHHSPDIPFYGWHYPPPFLLVAALLATMPYVWALIVWQATTLLIALATVRRILPIRGVTLAACGAPVVLVCLGHGHNGFLTAALLGGGLLLLDRRPFVAGLLLGCMIYKPQFALVLPVVLLLGWHWRAIGGALASAGLLCALTLVLWGWPVWAAFIHSLPLTQSVVIEQGATGWEKIQSAFSAVRNWGGSIPLAYGIQTGVTAIAVAGAALVSRGTPPFVRNAMVIAAALLSTPYLLDYDLVPLGMAIAFLVAEGRERGFLTYEKTVLALVWIVPLFGRSIMQLTTVPLGLMSIVAIFVIALRRSRIRPLSDC
ncbi:glycosyltransferase family 87 protein [Sphingomonas sp.]|uniref:glycosyltransferase family 87 protein n=1 Tax=Sphingomonas sp. TaxID=28214 RepID=UPI0025DABAF0|nr:glycosyltransferase family 87 protein [Sphingomonas sp.]